MPLLQEWGVPLSVLAMLLAASFMARLMSGYQAHQADVGAAVRRLEFGLATISAALEALGKVPLSRELRVTLRGEIHARYQRIRHLYPRYPGIRAKIQAAERAFEGERAPAGGGVGRIEGERALHQTIAALDQLMAVLQRGNMLVPVPPDVRTIFRRELAGRRAEVMSRFLMVAARQHQNQGNPAKARACLTRLMYILRQAGPMSAYVRALYNEADRELSALANAQLVLGSGRKHSGSGTDQRLPEKRAIAVGTSTRLANVL